MYLFEYNLFGITIAPSYYGLMYVLGFIFGYLILRKRKYFTQAQLDDIIMYIFAGVILGGRIGYMLFYNTHGLIADPLSLLYIWEGGMSFHGGLIGVIGALLLFAKKYAMNFYHTIDEVALVVPIGIFFGRIGNYINGELLGFSGYSGPLSIDGRFPSPLLEAVLEGIILGIILWYVSQRKKFIGQIASLFLILYTVFRIFVEVFFRQPDAHIGYILPFISLGTLLSIPMLIIGIYLYYTLQKK